MKLNTAAAKHLIEKCGWRWEIVVQGDYLVKDITTAIVGSAHAQKVVFFVYLPWDQDGYSQRYSHVVNKIQSFQVTPPKDLNEVIEVLRSR